MPTKKSKDDDLKKFRGLSDRELHDVAYLTAIRGTGNLAPQVRDLLVALAERVIREIHRGEEA